MVFLSRRQQFPRKIFDALSHSECRTVLEILHLAMQADRAERVRDLLAHVRNGFGFTCAVGGLLRLGPNRTIEGLDHVVNAGYPDDWLKLYCRRGLVTIDPILTSILREPGAFHWRTIYQRLSPGRERRFIATMRTFGLHDGITAGSIVQTQSLAAFCSFARDRALDTERVVPLMDYLSAYILPAIRRIASPMVSKRTRRLQNLSSRELTILLWMKAGKTNWEIGRVLSVSERTVRFHVENIFTKLDVVSRSQAVAVALEQGFPHLTDTAVAPCS
jgi:DNA-binding CsgD family transcriptional regulator